MGRKFSLTEVVPGHADQHVVNRGTELDRALFNRKVTPQSSSLSVYYSPYINVTPVEAGLRIQRHNMKD